MVEVEGGGRGTGVMEQLDEGCSGWGWPLLPRGWRQLGQLSRAVGEGAAARPQPAVRPPSHGVTMEEGEVWWVAAVS